MPKNCAVVRCNSSARMRERKFFRFPMLQHSSTQSLAITKIRQELWVRALNRVDFPPSRYKHATICDRHFVSGKSAHYADVKNVDWIPSLNLGYETCTFEVKIEPNEEDPLQCDILEEVTPFDSADDIFVIQEVTAERLDSDDAMLCDKNIKEEPFEDTQ